MQGRDAREGHSAPHADLVAMRARALKRPHVLLKEKGARLRAKA